MSRSAEEIEALANSSTQRDWLYLQHETGMSRKEISEDEGVQMILVAYLADKKANGTSNIAKWLDTPLTEVMEFLDIEDLEEDPAPKEQKSA
jgi:predicted transcriptional regulator